MQVLSAQDLGRANRNRVLQSLVDNGPLSRAELSRILGVPRASIGTIINALVAAGVLAERATDEPVGRGKPPRPLWFAETAGLSGGVAVQPDHVLVGVVNARGDVVSVSRSELDPTADYQTLRRSILQLSVDVLRDHDVASIGLSVPAQCNAARSTIELCTLMPALTHSTLPIDLAEATGKRVVLEQDVRALASAERWFGSGRAAKSLVAVQVDTGVGVGIVADGHLFPGADVSSPQFGHMQVDRMGETCSCGSRGCWETIASMGWLAAEASSRAILTSHDVLNDLAAQAEQGAGAALKLIDAYLANLVVGLTTIHRLFRNDSIVLEGSLARAPQWIIDRMQDLVNHDAMIASVAPTLIPSILGAHAPVLGAGAAALSQELGVRL